ncbi:hypothetical protein BH24ACI2_BH24ACI2_09420 [soil metagenome]|jgi:hypothetical protein|nr:hypothetical protein [Acidobacteriota bacterium]
MQTDVAEAIFDIVKVLPKTKQEKVLTFVSELKAEEETSLESLFRKIEERSQNIPDEVWEEIPSDGSINHDHYLYGAKKQK